jgi:LPXTG-motif cell wall-anchored protein
VKKLILAFITVAFIGLGGVPAHAQDDAGPVDCVDQPSDNPNDPCYNPALYPPTTPVASIAPPTTTTTLAPLAPPTSLPKTGSGVSSILSIGALLVLGGGLVVVAARRRSTSTSPAT